MSHHLHNYLSQQLDKSLRKDRVVVFYDVRSDFEPFMAELEEVGVGIGDLPRTLIGDTLTHIVRFDGSFFALKMAIEPVLEMDKPEPLLVYIGGEQRDATASPLMELEKAGTTYEPQLRRLARNLLRDSFTDGDIDTMLKTDNLTYQDVIRFIGQGGEKERPSILKVIFHTTSSETILARWLAGTGLDRAIDEKGAFAELCGLLESRLGLALDSQGTPAKARHQVWRFVLVNEFRDDLRCEAPSALEIIPSPPSKDHLKRCRALAAGLRQDHWGTYTAMADDVEDELGLARLGIDAADLGSVDTFRFEEEALLSHAGELVAEDGYELALAVITERGSSSWVDRDVCRLAQWEVCRLTAELGLQVTRVQISLQKAGKSAELLIEEYTREGGWYEVDRAQRSLETLIAGMDEEPEAGAERALVVVRRAYENLLEEMAQRFSDALKKSGWAIPDVLHQTRVFPEVVKPMGGRTAYFFVDAMRFEMGAELLRQLPQAEDARLRPAVTALPSITVVGMAALLPGASSSFSVIEHKSGLASRIDQSVLGSSAERMKYLKADTPGAVDIELGQLLHKGSKSLAKKLGDTSLLIVRSQGIDLLGEADGGMLARHVMDTVIVSLARAVRKLASIGFEAFVISADHGHQFSLRKNEDMLMDKPGGDTVELHRRVWAGRGGQTSSACLRVTGAELGYDSDLDFIFPKGLSVFKAGGDLTYHHGGISLQEMVVPVLSLRIPKADIEASSSTDVEISGLPEVITNRTFGVNVSVPPALFSTEPIAMRLVILAEGQEVGQAGMAVNAEFDSESGQVMVTPGAEVTLAMILKRDDCKTVRIIARDPATDAVLAQSGDIKVKLGM